MSGTKPTPGPWVADADDVVSQADKIAANWVCRAPERDLESYGYWQANARAIAAVPDLIKALQAAEKWYEHSPIINAPEWVTLMRAALAKALEP